MILAQNCPHPPLQGLREVCETSLVRALSKENVVNLLLLADRHNATGLKAAALQFLKTSPDLLVSLCKESRALAAAATESDS